MGVWGFRSLRFRGSGFGFRGEGLGFRVYGFGAGGFRGLVITRFPEGFGVF